MQRNSVRANLTATRAQKKTAHPPGAECRTSSFLRNMLASPTQSALRRIDREDVLFSKSETASLLLWLARGEYTALRKKRPTFRRTSPFTQAVMAQLYVYAGQARADERTGKLAAVPLHRGCTPASKGERPARRRNGGAGEQPRRFRVGLPLLRGQELATLCDALCCDSAARASRARDVRPRWQAKVTDASRHFRCELTSQYQQQPTPHRCSDSPSRPRLSPRG